MSSARGSAEIIRADARQLPLADDSVDLVVTSPPYFGLRSYQDGGEHYAGQIGDEPTPQAFIDSLLEVTLECRRVLKPSGSLWVNLGDKYSDRAGPVWAGSSDRLTGRPPKPRRASSTSMAPRKSLLGIPWRYALRCIDEVGLLLRAEVIWSKPNGMPESVTDRVRRAHEQWFHFTLQARYFSAVDEIREAPKPGQSAAALSFNRIGRDTAPGQTCAPHRLGRGDDGLHPLGKLPSSVWEVATEPLHVPEWLGADHFAAFPTKLPRRIVLGWSPEGGTVVDPFGGTGTTALVAKALGRRGVSLDRSADYCRIAEWRTNDPDQVAKAARRPKPKVRVADDQLGILSLLEGEAAS